jgi:NADH dehydrogenase
LSDSSRAHHVVIVGAGFGGLEVARRLARAPVRITIIDQRNHHLFQPLLYQVATASLATSEIAWPVRHLLRKRKEVTTLLAVVTGIASGDGKVLLEDGGVVAYDTLVLATGARHAYFGHDEWESDAPGLKTLEDATTIRRRILLSFERAERETDPERLAALLTFVIVGGGPTGVELAGTIAELAHENLREDFRHIDTRKARIILIEAGPRILPGFTEDSSPPMLMPRSSGWESKLNSAARSANATITASSSMAGNYRRRSFSGLLACEPRPRPIGSVCRPITPTALRWSRTSALLAIRRSS